MSKKKNLLIIPVLLGILAGCAQAPAKPSLDAVMDSCVHYATVHYPNDPDPKKTCLDLLAAHPESFEQLFPKN
jgi:hypothetical protein